jgi:hypothetical protein
MIVVLNTIVGDRVNSFRLPGKLLACPAAPGRSPGFRDYIPLLGERVADVWSPK